MDHLAAGLLALDLQRGERVGIWGPNSYEWVVVQWAAARAGLVLVILPPSLRFALSPNPSARSNVRLRSSDQQHPRPSRLVGNLSLDNIRKSMASLKASTYHRFRPCRSCRFYDLPVSAMAGSTPVIARSVVKKNLCAKRGSIFYAARLDSRSRKAGGRAS